MGILASLLLVCFVGFIEAEEMIDPPAEENQPYWVLLLVIFIVSTLATIIVGMIALVRHPVVPELPDFQEPNFDIDHTGSGLWRHNDNNTSYQEYPLPTHDESFPMVSLSGHQTAPQSAPSQTSGTYPAHSYEPQSYPPVTVMTQRM